MRTFRTYDDMFSACLAYVTTEREVLYKGRLVFFCDYWNSCEIKKSNGDGWESMNRRKHRLKDFTLAPLK